jgi:hypothetical protein
MPTFPFIVYALCLASSLACTGLLIRSYARNGTTLLLWCALGFVGLSVNNLFLFLDLALFAEIDFRMVRHLSALAAVAVLLYGFIWEVD